MYAECRKAECRYAECRGTKISTKQKNKKFQNFQLLNENGSNKTFFRVNLLTLLSKLDHFIIKAIYDVLV